MSEITIANLQSTGAELFNDPESFLNELSNDDLNQIQGGRWCPTAVIPTIAIGTAVKPCPPLKEPIFKYVEIPRPTPAVMP
jgi:bacteriocin-like protein